MTDSLSLETLPFKTLFLSCGSCWQSSNSAVCCIIFNNRGCLPCCHQKASKGLEVSNKKLLKLATLIFIKRQALTSVIGLIFISYKVIEAWHHVLESIRKYSSITLELFLFPNHHSATQQVLKIIFNISPVSQLHMGGLTVITKQFVWWPFTLSKKNLPCFEVYQNFSNKWYR